MKKNAEINAYFERDLISNTDLKKLDKLLSDFQFDDIFEIITINPRVSEFLSKLYESKRDITEFIKIAELYEVYTTINDLDNSETTNFNTKHEKQYRDDMYEQQTSDTIRYPLLSDAETEKLFLEMQEGSIEAEAKLLKHNLRLVLKETNRNTNKGLDESDIYQEGCIGLLKAIRRFDIKRGFKFSTYATYWIRQRIGLAIFEKSRNIRIPNYTYQKASEMNKIITNFEAIYNREPTIDELAKIMNLSKKRVSEIYGARFDTLSLNKLTTNQTSETDGTEFGYFIADKVEDPEESFIKKERSAKILEFFASLELSDRDIQILYSRFEINGTQKKTLAELAEEFGVTHQAINQVEERVLRKIISMNKIDEFCNLTDNPKHYKKIFEGFFERLDLRPNRIINVNHILDAKKVTLELNENSEFITVLLDKSYYQLNIRILCHFSEDERQIIYEALSHEQINIPKIAKKVKQTEEYVLELLYTYYTNFQTYLVKYTKSKENTLNNIVSVRTKKEAE